MRRTLHAIQDELITSYLPLEQLDESMHCLIEEAKQKLIEIATPRVVYQTFDIVQGQLQDCLFPLCGNDIQTLLKDCHQCIVLAGTLGSAVDQWCKKVQLQDMGKAYVYDACANAAIEQVMDDMQEELRRNVLDSSLYLSDRYAPGYGDFPLEVQSLLLKQLDATRKIGLSITPSNLMIPCKSITGLIGISKKPQPSRIRGCDKCALREVCERRKEGFFCGKK